MQPALSLYQQPHSDRRDSYRLPLRSGADHRRRLESVWLLHGPVCLHKNFIKTTISNTALSDFVEVVSEPDSDISCMKGYSIYIMPNSIAYFQTITPYLVMTEGQIHVDGDLAINMNKMYDTLRLGKGYYELLAIKGTEKAIFRFNNEAFKNNYGISDLLQMNLCFYGVEVGKGKPDQFDFSKMFTDEGKVLTDFDQVMSEKEANEPLPIYDIILAGVE